MNCSSSQQQLEIGSGSNNEQCLLLSLHRTLRRLQYLLDGQGVTCRRANGDQKRALLNFGDNIQEYYSNYSLHLPQNIVSLVNLKLIMNACVHGLLNFHLYPSLLFIYFQQLPREPCRYRSLSMTDHIKSLYTLVPPLSNLTSSEAQLITGNLTEVILPIVRLLVVSTGLHSIDTYLSFVNY